MTSRTDAVAEGGFTLLEVLVVVLLLGLVAGITLGRGPVRSPAIGLRAAAGELGRTLRAARTRAITTNRVVLVRLDAPGRTYAVEGSTARSLPPQFDLTLATVASGALPGGGTAIAFAPDGSSSGGRVGLAAGGQRIEVAVDWLTGRVAVSPLGTRDAR